MKNKILNKLKKLAKNSTNQLEEYVANYALDNYSTDEEIKTFFSDLFQSGCQSGMISSLIYYQDTKEFFIKYEDEINELKEEFEESTGETLKISGKTSNFLAWFGFEEMARNIANRIGLEF